MVDISVVLYVHNCGDFLKESLDSLINQSFDNFEIICVDDGSEDNSSELLIDYSKRDYRIKIISINGVGFSKALNHTINSVESKYIYIMKPSVYLKSNALDTLFNKAEKNNADIILADTNYQYSNIYYKANSISEIQQNIGKLVFNHKDMENRIFSIDSSLENKFYRLDFIKNNELKFFEDLIYPEYLFFYNSLLLADRIGYLNEFLFDYIKPFEFIRRDEIKIENIFKEYNLILDIFREINEFNFYKNNFLELKLSFFMGEYGRIKEHYKEFFFSILRWDLINNFLSEDFQQESIEVLSHFNRKIFEHILISENIYEFELLRKNLFITNEFNRFLDKKSFLKSISKI